MSAALTPGLALETALLLQVETLRERLMARSAEASEAASRLAAATDQIGELMEAVRSLRAGLTAAQRLCGTLGRALDAIARLEKPGTDIASDIARETLRGLTEADLRTVKAGVA